MQAIKSKGTKAEVALGKALWAAGHRYRKNNKKVFGRPDFTFSKQKVAIFVDGEYFHGHCWETEKYRIKTNREFWWKKIEGNIERDILVNHTLLEDGWTVLRFWTNEVKKNLSFCVQKIQAELANKNSKKP